MKAKKSSPKSIRFNIEDFEKGMRKGKFESAQDMVDSLLRNYVDGKSDGKTASVPKVANETKQELSKSEMFKMIRDGKI